MKIMYKFLICLGLVLFSTPIISGQDLSRYRKFSLGTSLADLSKQVGPYSHETTLAHQRPAVIQEMTFWPLSPSRSRGRIGTGFADFVQLLQWRALQNNGDL